jgi:predicted ester cyclase
MSPDELRYWFEDYLEVCNRHDLDGIRQRLAPDVRRTGAPGGADAWLRDVETLLSAFPDYRWKRISVLVEGDRLAAHLRTRGTHRGPFRGLRPTGRHVGIAAFGFYRIAAGRIVEHTGTDDAAELLAQLER